MTDKVTVKKKVTTKKKKVKEDTIIKSVERKSCSMQLSQKCKEEHDKDNGRKLTDFYMTINNYFFKAKKVHICKDCIKEFVYTESGDINLKNFKKILQVLDMPFIQKDFDSSVADKNDTFGTYYKNIALNHLGKSYEDGDNEEFSNVVKASIRTEQEIRGFWGDGFNDKEYNFLEDELARWKQTHKCDVQAEITLLREICTTVLDIRNARKEGKPTKELRKELQDLMKTASVDPAKANSIGSGQTVDRFGVWLKDIEDKKPSEWWEDQEKYKDADGFLPYIKDYIVRPIRNFFSGNKDFMINGEDLSFKEEKDDKVSKEVE